jgi:hypothetical protein
MPTMSDNAAMFGKGHEFATRNEILSWDVRFRRAFQATTKILGWAWAFHCGVCNTTSNGGGAFTHVYEYQDPITGTGYYGSPRQQPVVTIVEQVTSGITRRFPSCVVAAVEITGALNDWVRMSMDLIGSGKKDNPAPTTYSFVFPDSTVPAAGGEGTLLRNASLTFELGPTGTYSDRSCEVQSYRFRSEYSYFEAEGYCPGSGYQISGDPSSGQIRNALEFNRRAVIFEFVMKAMSGDDLHQRLERSTRMSARLTIVGDTISGAFAHRMIISIPSVKFRAVPIGVDGDKIIFTVQTVVMWDSSLVNPFEITVGNTTAAYLTSS